MPPKFIPRQRKHKARFGPHKVVTGLQGQSAPEDTNISELLPESKDERAARRQQLREEVRAMQPASKTSSKKNKRLEKYIDKKLRAEESIDLIKKLSHSKIDTSLLQSSRKLGRRSETKREGLSRALYEAKAGIKDDDHEDILFEEIQQNDENAEDISIPWSRVALSTATPQLSTEPTVVTFGSGLKRPLELDETGMPIIQKRRKRNVRPRKNFSRLSTRNEPCSDPDSNSQSDSESEWAGLSNSSSSDNSPKRGDLSESENESDEHDSDTSSQDDSSDFDSEMDEASSISEPAVDRNSAARSSAFKSWASEVRNSALGFQPSFVTNYLDSSTLSKSGQDIPGEKAGSNSKQPNTSQSQVKQPIVPEIDTQKLTVHNVAVQRSNDIQASRLKLPIVAEEQKIMESIRANDCTVIWGATGSGKTTQVPQFLLEAGYGDPKGPHPGLIGVTQPRRVAAVSMAKRVALELGDLQAKVAHQIRFDSSISSNTAIKFMTDGVLLREITQDFTLSKYAAIIIDEAHERSLNTDVLIGMLSRIVETRARLHQKSSSHRPLKLIIMSATLAMTVLTENAHLFRKGVPPVVQAEGRQHPVTMHFARRTQRDYVEEMLNKIRRGHRKLPPGGMLVFLTGQNEINHVMKKLEETFEPSERSTRVHQRMKVSAETVPIETEDIEISRNGRSFDDFDSDSDSEIIGVDNDEDREFDIGDDTVEVLKVHVLPLYSQLPTDQQMRIFEDAPEGSRLIVLATNVAETSLTIPGIRYVFDCGRAKEKVYDPATGVQSYEVSWISKASASQRTGRAGRTGPGHCYRLYSSAVYERDFAEFATPEILRTPVEGVVLQLKSLGIPSVASFPFPTPPERQSLIAAERLLEYLQAVEGDVVTKVGRALSVYPLSPRLSKIIYLSQLDGMVEHGVSAVAMLAASDIFIPQSQVQVESDPSLSDAADAAQGRERQTKEYNAFHGLMSRTDRASDALKMLTTLHDYALDASDQTGIFGRYTRSKALREALQLRQQLLRLVSTHTKTSLSGGDSIALPSRKESHSLRTAIVGGYIDQVAIRADMSPSPPENLRKPKRATDVPYQPLLPLSGDSASNSSAVEDPEMAARRRFVYIHPGSVLAHTGADQLPQYIVYSHLSRASPSHIAAAGPGLGPETEKIAKTRMHPLTPIDAAQLVRLAQGTPLCEEGKPVGKAEQLARSAAGHERRAVWTVPFLKAEKGALGWPLPPARKVVQARIPGKGWVNEGAS